MKKKGIFILVTRFYAPYHVVMVNMSRVSRYYKQSKPTVGPDINYGTIIEFNHHDTILVKETLSEINTLVGIPPPREDLQPSQDTTPLSGF